MNRRFASGLLTICICWVLFPASAGASSDDAPRPLALRGTLDVVQEDDFASDRTARRYRIAVSATGKVYDLRFAGDQPSRELRTGAEVFARGLARGNQLSIGESEDSGVEVLAEAAAATTGNRHVVVLVVDFADSTVSCSDSSIASLMFTGTQSVDGLYQASSFGQLALPHDTDNDGMPDVFRVSIADSIAGSCDYYGWATAAESAATAAGVDLGLYRHRVLVLPSNVNCGWAGLGNVGCGSYCRAWIKTCHLGDVYAHEIGHNLEMAHASTDDNNDGQPDCEYCDQSDPMGYGGVGWRLFNGAHEHQMGWLPSGQIVDLTGEGTTTHVLSPLNVDPAVAVYPQLLRIFKPDSGDYYYLSYRIREGYDGSLNPAYADRTSIHRYTGSGYNRTLFQRALQDGETFDDGSSGFVVTQLAHDATSATLQISSECAALPNDVLVTPADQPGLPGDALDYTVRVTNNDPLLCGTTTFDLSAAAPGGWSTSLSTASMTLAPGDQGQATLSVTSAIDALDGDYAVSVDAYDPLESAHQASGSAVYAVDTMAPDPVDDLVASIKRKTQVQLSWSLPFDAGSGVASFDLFRDGAWIATTSATSHTDRNTSAGQTYVYHLTASDRVGNRSGASNLAEITVGGSGGGGGKGGGSEVGGGGRVKEVCDDGLDNDNDGSVDCSDSDCRRAKVCR